jgi:hypothetical protein
MHYLPNYAKVTNYVKINQIVQKLHNYAKLT